MRISPAIICRTLGEDAIFFSMCPTPLDGLPLPPQGVRMARCQYEESASDLAGNMLEPLLWVQCGQMAQLDSEGDYICAEHMQGWYCLDCGALLPAYCLPPASCERCANPQCQESHPVNGFSLTQRWPGAVKTVTTDYDNAIYIIVDNG